MNDRHQGLIRIISLSPPTLKDNTADADRIVRAITTRLETDIVEFDLKLLYGLPARLRKWDFQVKCVLCKDRGRWILTGITSAKDTSLLVGLAVDLGTTTVALHFINLLTGDTLAEASFDNPQIAIGPDILSRIHYADKNSGSTRLQHLIINALNRQIHAACSRRGMDPENIYVLSVAGNTAMTHFFMGLDPHWMIRAPYIPVVNRPGLLKAHDLGIMVNPLARVLIFPNSGSYFGGDLIAGILFAGIHKREDVAILIDVGTNAEVVLGNRDWLIACAGAAGPALEGGVTQMGMMAGPGVIDHIDIDPETKTFLVHTIDGIPPKGICGSGLVELAAQLFRSGMIDFQGELVPDNCGDNLKDINGFRHLVIVPSEMSATGEDLVISQTDLDSLIRSKAAMYTILEIISSTVGISLSDISTFYVAGTFGTFISPEAAITIGMLPDLPLSRFVSLGNSSIGGASMALTDASSLEEIDKIKDHVTYLELNVNQEFMTRFSAARFLPHTDRSRFPSVKGHRSS